MHGHVVVISGHVLEPGCAGDNKLYTLYKCRRTVQSINTVPTDAAQWMCVICNAPCRYYRTIVSSELIKVMVSKEKEVLQKGGRAISVPWR